MGQQVNVYKSLNLMPGAIVTGSWNGSFDTGGTTYYVNNVTGSSTADGLSWNSCVDQVSTAITLSEASRQIHPGDSNNDYIRNTIVVQGTGDYLGTEGGYDSLTDLGEHYNLIGLGTPGAMGHGVGVVRIGHDTGNTGGGVKDASGDYRGVYIANVQFVTGDTSPAFYVRRLRTSTIEDCAFMVAPIPTGTANAYFKLGAGGYGIILRRCSTSGSAAITNRPSYGINLDGCTEFSQSRVEQCHIGGSTGFYNPSTQTLGMGTVVRDNVIGDIGHGVMVTAIRDECQSTPAVSGLITYVNNYLQATYPMYLLGTYERAIMNYCDNVVVTENI